jgi:hypothetical protein
MSGGVSATQADLFRTAGPNSRSHMSQAAAPARQEIHTPPAPDQVREADIGDHAGFREVVWLREKARGNRSTRAPSKVPFDLALERACRVVKIPDTTVR